MEMGYLDCKVSQTYFKNSGGVGKTGESLVSLQEECGLVRTKYFIGAFKIHFSICFFLFICMSDMFSLASHTSHRSFYLVALSPSLQISYSSLFIRPNSS